MGGPGTYHCRSGTKPGCIIVKVDHGFGLWRPDHEYDTTFLGIAPVRDHRVESKGYNSIYPYSDADRYCYFSDRLADLLKSKTDADPFNIRFVLIGKNNVCGFMRGKLPTEDAVIFI